VIALARAVLDAGGKELGLVAKQQAAQVQVWRKAMLGQHQHRHLRRHHQAGQARATASSVACQDTGLVIALARAVLDAGGKELGLVAKQQAAQVQIWRLKNPHLEAMLGQCHQDQAASSVGKKGTGPPPAQQMARQATASDVACLATGPKIAPHWSLAEVACPA